MPWQNTDLSVPDGGAGARRRDWLVLPLLVLATIAIMIGAVTMVASKAFPPKTTNISRCLQPRSPHMGPREIPNSVCVETHPEHPAAEIYAFNNCGHRAGVPCGPKAPGTFRIVMLGSSFALGALEQREQTFAATLPQQLSQRTGRHVELYNESGGWGWNAHSIAMSFPEVLQAKPDLIVWVVTPGDLKTSEQEAPLAPGSDLPDQQSPLKAKNLAEFRTRLKALATGRNPPKALASLLTVSTMMQHFLYQSPSLYVPAYMSTVDAEHGFLAAHLSEDWQEHLKDFNQDDAELERQAQAAGVPVVTTYVPHRAQATMLSSGVWPKGADPYKIDNELSAIVTSHGGTFVDLLPDFRSLPEAQKDYFPVDGHPNARGHAAISAILARELTRGNVPLLTSTATARPAG